MLSRVDPSHNPYVLPCGCRLRARGYPALQLRNLISNRRPRLIPTSRRSLPATVSVRRLSRY